SGRSRCWDQRLGEGRVLTAVDLLDSQSIANAASLPSRSGSSCGDRRCLAVGRNRLGGTAAEPAKIVP
ncbi:MAG TPA: hypothetical protein VFI46_02235, partial [Jiangellaceae bacterium]|nr:hypothetical protein [Jiangellaceae bacterium]